MPIIVRRFITSIFVVLVATAGFAYSQAPTTVPPSNPANNHPTTPPVVEKQPTSAEIMRERISKAKAFIAVRNYNAAIYELENIRRETSDQSVNAVTNVLLMNAYLEQGDHKRAQNFLNEFFKSYKSNSANGNMYYAAVAAQVIKGARSQVERYRALGLSVSDRNLPLEAVNDIERMRETLELVITQAKELGVDKAKSGAAMALLEEATNSRSMIARDDYDARRWRDELGDSREQIASSRSVIINAVDGTTVAQPVVQDAVATNTPPMSASTNPPVSNNVPTGPTFNPVTDNSKPKVPETLVASNTKPQFEPVKENPAASDSQRNRMIENKPTVQVPVPQTAAPKSDAPAPSGPLEVGSLISYATKQQAPVYPPAARSMRTTGIVKVEVTVSESGEVAEVKNTTGPMMLQAAAKDAIRKWRFKPFVRDGQPVRASGFVNFNFAL